MPRQFVSMLPTSSPEMLSYGTLMSEWPYLATPNGATFTGEATLVHQMFDDSTAMTGSSLGDTALDFHSVNAEANLPNMDCMHAFGSDSIPRLVKGPVPSTPFSEISFLQSNVNYEHTATVPEFFGVSFSKLNLPDDVIGKDSLSCTSGTQVTAQREGSSLISDNSCAGNGKTGKQRITRKRKSDGANDKEPGGSKVAKEKRNRRTKKNCTTVNGENANKNKNKEHSVESTQKVAEEETSKGYVHVRARRGEATDSHSLAERARREKIRERMSYLQELVPGCSKVTGKAMILDEIIRYVRSLQRQVAFLSMKLATASPQFDSSFQNLIPTEDIPQQLNSTKTGGPSLSDLHMMVTPTGTCSLHEGESNAETFQDHTLLASAWDAVLQNVCTSVRQSGGQQL